MKLFTLFLLGMVAVPCFAQPFVCKSLTVGIGTEMNPAGYATFQRVIDLRGGDDKVSLRLTDESFSDDTSRQTLYVGQTGKLTQLAIRTDTIDRLWVGLNIVQPVSKDLTLVFRPFVGVKDNTANRAYLFADYQPGGKVSFMAATLAMDDYKTDVYVGPTWRDKNISLFTAPSISKKGCYYWEISLSTSF